jgi:hypothetical protein
MRLYKTYNSRYNSPDDSLMPPGPNFDANSAMTARLPKGRSKAVKHSASDSSPGPGYLEEFASAPQPWGAHGSRILESTSSACSSAPLARSKRGREMEYSASSETLISQSTFANSDSEDSGFQRPCDGNNSTSDSGGEGSWGGNVAPSVTPDSCSHSLPGHQVSCWVP